MVNMLSTVGHKLPVALSNCLVLSVSAKVLKFSPFYFCKSVCWAYVVHGEKCENLPLYSHISLGSTSQQNVELPKCVWDALGIHKDTLDPCCPIARAAGGCWHQGGAAWPGWAVAVTRHHHSRAWDCLVAELKSWSRGTHSGGCGGPQELFHPVPLEDLWKHVESGTASIGHIPWPAGAQDTGTISSQSRGCCHMATPPGFNSGFPWSWIHATPEVFTCVTAWILHPYRKTKLPVLPVRYRLNTGHVSAVFHQQNSCLL